MINHESSEVFHFDREVFMASEDRLFVKIGENTFSEEGITLALRSPSLTIEGTISYGEFTPLKGVAMPRVSWDLSLIYLLWNAITEF